MTCDENVNCQKNNMNWMKASVTVENALVMPLTLACIALLIIMNGYLHDLVILDGISVEVLYGESDDKEKLFQEVTRGQLLWLHNAVYSEEEDSLKKILSWEKAYSLPVKGILSLIVDNTELELSGKAQRQSWSMSQIIRYVGQN